MTSATLAAMTRAPMVIGQARVADCHVFSRRQAPGNGQGGLSGYEHHDDTENDKRHRTCHVQTVGVGLGEGLPAAAGVQPDRKNGDAPPSTRCINGVRRQLKRRHGRRTPNGLYVWIATLPGKKPDPIAQGAMMAPAGTETC
jgi:hypothetical protein